LIDKTNSGARNALHKFSEMLRYQLYEMNDDKIPVEKEIRYLNDYVDLQKLRNDPGYSVSFTCEPSVSGFVIEPLLLIPFVENAFKHISHFKGQLNYIRIAMNYTDGELYFEVENSTEEPAAATDYRGIGLTNVKRRLALLYPVKHRLEISNKNQQFKVALRIKIK
ncbi:MAG: histidine kinase, partial [Ferruginibacter sp.]